MLPHFVETLDDIPEAAHEFYTEVDGGFRLGVSGVEPEETVKGLKSTLEKLKRETRELKERASRVSDEDIEELERLRVEAEEREHKKAEQEGDFAKIREGIEAKHRKELADREKREGRKDRFIEKLVVINELNQAMEAAKIPDHYRPGVRAILREKGFEVEEDGEDYRGVIRTDLGTQRIAEFFETWVQTPEAEPYLAPVDKGGSGNRGSGGGDRRGGDQSVQISDGSVTADPQEILDGKVTVEA